MLNMVNWNLKLNPKEQHNHDHKNEEEKRDEEKMETNEKLSQIKDTQIEKVSSEISNKENAKPENSQQKIDISKERISTSKESIDTSKNALEIDRKKEIGAEENGKTLQIQMPSTADDKEEVKVKEVKKSAREITNTKSMGSYFPQESTRQQAQNKGKPTLIISGTKPVTGTRPFSAVDAYKYIVAHPIKQPTGSADNSFATSYQQQRTEVWKQNVLSPRSTGTVPSTARRKSPPPQRPSSPASRIPPHHRPRSAVLQVTAGNGWLAGGRDLHWEKMSQRPRNSHIPGWKEGLPDGLRRPKSAVANRTYKRSRASTPVTPSSLAYDNMIHGWRSPPGSLPELTDLSDYYHPYHQHLIRQLGSSPQTGHANFYVPPSQDTVYRWS